MEGERKVYQIADRKFYQEELVFGQEAWMRDHVFCGRSVTSLSTGQLMEMLQEHAMTFLAVILIEDTMTQSQKIEAGWAAAVDLRNWLNAHVRPREVMEYVNDFFGVNTSTNLWLLADTKSLTPRSEIGSPTASSSLVTVT